MSDIVREKYQLKMDYGATFGTEQGQRVLDDLYKACHMNETIAVRGDSHDTYFRDGARSVFLRITKIMNFDLRKFDQKVVDNA